MALPKPSYPVYNLTIPSLDKKIKFRPFLVKEEKSLLIAQQSEEIKVMVDTVKSIIKSCVLDPIDIDSLAIFDVEYMFTQIRSKSVGETVDLIFTCAHCKEKNNKIKIEIDLTKIPMVTPPNHNKKIQLEDNLGVIMRYPRIDALVKVDKGTDNVETNLEAVIDCIEAVYDDTEVFYTAEQTKEEILEDMPWQNFSPREIELIEEAFNKMDYYFESKLFPKDPKIIKKFEVNDNGDYKLKNQLLKYSSRIIIKLRGYMKFKLELNKI